VGDSPDSVEEGSSCRQTEGGFTMAAIELGEKEVTSLISALESYLPDLATERVGTDNKEWHAELKEQETILGDILKRLKTVKI